MRALDEYDPQKLIYNAILDNGTNVGNASASLFVTLPNSQAGGAAQGFFQELLATAVLAIVVLALGDEVRRATSHLELALTHPHAEQRPSRCRPRRARAWLCRHRDWNVNGLGLVSLGVLWCYGASSLGVLWCFERRTRLSTNRIRALS